jgi:hypothetical protein
MAVIGQVPFVVAVLSGGGEGKMHLFYGDYNSVIWNFITSKMEVIGRP